MLINGIKNEPGSGIRILAVEQCCDAAAAVWLGLTAQDDDDDDVIIARQQNCC